MKSDPLVTQGKFHVMPHYFFDVLLWLVASASVFDHGGYLFRVAEPRRGISCTFYCTFPALFLHFFSTRTARQTIFFLREQRAAAAATQFVHSSFKQHNGINTTTHHTLVSICLLLRNSLYLFTVFISGYWTHTLKQSFDTVDVLDRKRDGF